MRLAVVDTETTGDKDHDQVLELAINLIWESPGGGYTGLRRWHTMLKPSVPCSFEARAIHHITDRELEGAPDAEQLMTTRGLPEFDDGAAFVAHNAEFDLRLLRQSQIVIDNPVICTWKCAKHLFPDAPRHSNQVLRYWLGLDDKYPIIGTCALPAHRAPFDTLVTECLLMEMLRLKTPEELIQLTKTPVLMRNCTFGKHAGSAWGDVPKDYLRWIVGQGPKRQVAGRDEGFDEDTRHTAMWHLGMAEARNLAPVLSSNRDPAL